MTTGAHEYATRAQARHRPDARVPRAASGTVPGLAGDTAGRRPGGGSGGGSSGGAGSLPRLVAEQLGRRVGELVGDLVADLERTLPGAVDAAYVVGSAAQRDHHRDLDDVDVVVVLAGPPDALMGRLLDDVHRRVEQAHPELRPELAYTTWDDLGRPLTANRAHPGALGLVRRDGRTLTGPEHAPSALTRAQLLAHGLAVIGPSVSPARVATTGDDLTAHCLGEISGRWTLWWEQSALLLSAAGRDSLTPAVTDAVLRVARVHHTLVTGELWSLTDVGQWALTVCEPEWAQLLRESLRVRQDPRAASFYRSPLARRRQALAFTDLLMTADEEAFGVGDSAPERTDSRRQPEGRVDRGGRR